MENDYNFKIVIIGNSAVGKSALLSRYCEGKYEIQAPTLGVDLKSKKLEIDGKKIKLQISDTAGQERYGAITNQYYKSADGIVMVYDVSSRESFEDIDKVWIKQVEQYADKNVEFLLLGNKSDIENKAVTTKEVIDYATKKSMTHMEVSAMTADQVSKAFISLAKQLIAKKESQSEKDKKPPSSIVLSQKDQGSSTISKGLSINQQADDKIKKSSSCC